MKKMMSMIRAKKARLATAVLAAAMTMSMAAPMVASAHSAFDEPQGRLIDASISVETPETATLHSEAAMKAATNAAATTGQKSDRYYKRMKELQLRRWKPLRVTMGNAGLYMNKSIKFYGRKIVDVADNGDYILGKWEILYEANDTWGGKTFEITRDYAQFAFRFDIKWRTDFPCSGRLWDNVEDVVFDIDIGTNGGCRNANVYIKICYDKPRDPSNYYRVIEEKNCSSHDEWTP